MAWYGEPRRHALSARGIKNAPQRYKQYVVRPQILTLGRERDLNGSLDIRKKNLLPLGLRKKIPKLYATENIPIEDKVLAVKFFSPYTNWAWYVVEFDGEDTFFGYVVSPYAEEWGYFSLDELAKTQMKHMGAKAPAISRDLSWEPITFKEYLIKTKGGSPF